MEIIKAYKQRYVAFIDILGFKEAIYESPQNSEKFNEISIALEQMSHVKDIVSTVNEALKSSNNAYEAVWGNWEDVKVKTFSDNIFVSTAANHVGLMALGAYSCLIYTTLFANGFFARGAITKGDLFESQDIVFGKALIEAYELEPKTSIYPRILISNSILDEVKNATGFHLEKDYDGSYFLDVFFPGVRTMLDTWENRTNLDLNLEQGKFKLIEEYGAAKNQAVKSKLYWLIQYFNSRSMNHKIAPVENFK